MSVTSIRLGEYSEGADWELVADGEVQLVGLSAEVVCPHAVYVGEKKFPPAYESQTILYPTYRLRYLVRAFNECHNNVTEMCLDCILEAVGKR